MKRYQPLLSLIGIVGGLLLALPVKAAQFEDWTFDAQQNRLVFTTSGPVQPRAQFLFSPPRIILDLPGTTITQATASQVLGNNVGGLVHLPVTLCVAQTGMLVDICSMIILCLYECICVCCRHVTS